ISLALSLPHRNRADIGRIAPRMPCKSSFVSSTTKASASTTAPVVSECGIPCSAYTQEYPIPAHSSHQEPRRPKPPGNLRNLQENLSRNSKERIVSRYKQEQPRKSPLQKRTRRRTKKERDLLWKTLPFPDLSRYD